MRPERSMTSTEKSDDVSGQGGRQSSSCVFFSPCGCWVVVIIVVALYTGLYRARRPSAAGLGLLVQADESISKAKPPSILFYVHDTQ